MQPDPALTNIMSCALRAALGLTFIVRRRAKWRDVTGFVAGALVYGIGPERLVRPLAAALPFVEVVFGLLLVLGIVTQAAAVMVLLLVATFGVLVTVNLWRGHRVPCMCLGASSGDVIGLASLIRLGLIALMAAWIIAHADASWPPVSDVLDLTALGSMVVAIVVVLETLPAVEGVLRPLAGFRRRRLATLADQAKTAG